MAQRVYSTQFIAGNAASEYTYTVPAGYTALISCIDVYVGIVTEGGNFTAYYDGRDVFWSQGYAAPGEQNSRWRGKIVVPEGLYVEVTAGGTFACCVSGDLFLNPS